MSVNERGIVPLRVFLGLCSLTLALGAVSQVMVLPGALLVFHRLASGLLYPMVAVLLGWWALALRPETTGEECQADGVELAQG